MSRTCDQCGKRYNAAIKRVLLRGHLNPTKKNKQYPNLQSKKVPVVIKKGSKQSIVHKRMKLCTQCIRTISKKEAEMAK